MDAILWKAGVRKMIARVDLIYNLKRGRETTFRDWWRSLNPAEANGFLAAREGWSTWTRVSFFYPIGPLIYIGSLHKKDSMAERARTRLMAG